MLAKNEKGSRPEQSKVSVEWIGAASEEHRQWNRLCALATGRHSLWPPSAMQMICRGRLLLATVPLQYSSYSYLLPSPLHAWSKQCASLGHLLGGRATKIKTKQRFPIKATTWPPDNVATPPARNDSMRFDSGLVAKESHNSRPVIMRQMRAALAARHRHRRRRCCCRCQLYNVI